MDMDLKISKLMNEPLMGEKLIFRGLEYEFLKFSKWERKSANKVEISQFNHYAQCFRISKSKDSGLLYNSLLFYMSLKKAFFT